MSNPVRTPRVWLLLADKQGDNRQAQVVADLLELPVETRQVYPLPKYVKGKPWVRPTLSHLDLLRSDRLEPPWPDLIITVGRRPGMAALWVHKQSKGKTRIVMVGRQPRHLERYALVIASCQYITANDPRIVRIALPLDQPPAAETPLLPAEACTTLLVGGPTRTYRLSVADADAMVTEARRHAADTPLQIVTSRRTPAAVVERFAALQSPDISLLRWSPSPPPEQPSYAELIARSARFVVTGDSISMVCDAVRTGRPVGIYKLPYRFRLAERWHRLIAQVADRDGPGTDRAVVRALRWVADRRLLRLPRSFDAFFGFLIEHGSASDIRDGFLTHPVRMQHQDTGEIRARLAELVASIDRD